MIIHKCDICNKTAKSLDTIILYKRSFDYCSECKMEMEKLKESFKREVEEEYTILESRLRAKETKFLSKIKK